MADPLSFSAAIVGITVPALHGARLLLDDLKKVVNAPEAIGRLASEVDAISASLSLLKDIEEPVWILLGTAVYDQSKAAIQSCETSCNTIRSDIQRWTKRSREGKLSWLDRVNIGLFRDHQMKAHSDRLQTHRLSFTSIVAIATLYASVHNSQHTDELRDSIMMQHSQIAVANDSTQTEIAVVQRTLAEIQSHSISDPAADDKELDTIVLNLEELLEALKLSRTLLTELWSRSKPAEVAKSSKDSRTTNVTFGKNEKGMQIGVSHGSVTWNSDR